jgi:alkyl hydroperoxide reductase subunit AhpC
VELQSRVEELRRQGLGVAVITYDPPEVLADFARRRGITFPMLSDKGSATIRAYGLLNTTVAPGNPTYGIPFSGSFMLDRQGRVTARFSKEAYQERTTVSTILLKGGLGVERVATTAQTAHLSLRSWAGEETLVPGRHVSIVADVTPKPGMHVYAPGATSYRVVALVLDDTPGVRVLETGYPASETYFFAPLNDAYPCTRSRSA